MKIETENLVQKVYECALCGETYSTPLAMAECTIKCNEKLEEEKKRVAESLKKKELEDIEKKLIELYSEMKELVSTYNKKQPDWIYETKLKKRERQMIERNINNPFTFYDFSKCLDAINRFN